MLQKISIQNYVLIDRLDISFSGNFNVITGETGAGKSILVGALGLILGERADTSVLVNKENKCIVEGYFTPDAAGVKEFLQEHDIDPQDELVVRREISHHGKSRAFINDTPVTLAQLNTLSSMLVDLHHQFDTLSLGESGFQREVLDALAGQQALLDEYRHVYRAWQEVKKSLDQLQEQKRQSEKEADFNRFQYQELEEAGFRENEIEEMEAELKVLAHAEEIKGTLGQVVYVLSDGEQPLVPTLKTLMNQLQGPASVHPGLRELAARMESARIELQDIAGELERLANQVQHDPGRAEQLQERLSLAYKLQKKHGVQSTGELLGIMQVLESKLQEVLTIGATLDDMEKREKQLSETVSNLGKKLSKERHGQVVPLQEKVNALLTQVGMPNARLRIQVQDVAPGPDGMDHIEFLFAANLPAGDTGDNGSFQPVRKVASGGELSRLMLCIKSLVAESVDLPALIFDEIDTGISGEAARQVGLIMKKLASSRQVICITHQPQIAGKADTHFFVYKEIAGDAVQTHIRTLSTDERIVTVAKMLSGEKPTAAAMENAREMVMN